MRFQTGAMIVGLLLVLGVLTFASDVVMSDINKLAHR
jgi:hypothetical protein